MRLARTETIRRDFADFESDGTRCAAWWYRPTKPASPCPGLVVEATGDQLFPKSAIDATVSKLRDVNWVAYDTDHFGAFFCHLFVEVVEREGVFFEHHLLDATWFFRSPPIESRTLCEGRFTEPVVWVASSPSGMDGRLLVHRPTRLESVTCWAKVHRAI